MAFYDGFFDAVQDEDTGEYDRDYSSGDFTQYFGQIIGSGVCIHGNPDSFKVRLEDGKAVVSPGYLFIRGYWLKNDADYSVDLPGNGSYAITAHLNLGKRMIEVEVRSVEQAYPDSLVLAIVSTISAEDTRYNTDICGVIDTAGELSTKVEWAINYIDNEIESKLQQVESDIEAQAVKLDKKIAEVQAVADSIVPPPVGSIKFSASQDVGEEWLRCDGSFVNESDYPELVAALGKLTPGSDKFQLLSDGEIAPQITNGVLYGGRMWVYSYITRKLYGVDVEGAEAVKEIAVNSEDTKFNDFVSPTSSRPLALSIVHTTNSDKTKLFLAQILADGTAVRETFLNDAIRIFEADFSGSETAISVGPSIESYEILNRSSTSVSSIESIPYVISASKSAEDEFYCATSGTYGGYFIKWGQDRKAYADIITTLRVGAGSRKGQRLAYNKKNKGEAVLLAYSDGSEVGSSPMGLFSRQYYNGYSGIDGVTVPNATNIAGANKLVSDLTRSNLVSTPLTEVARSALVLNGLSLPSAARIFVDAAAYLWGKDIYMIFVGTGIIFSRTLEEGSFGYLDTTSVLGTITQFGYLDYSQDEGTLYLLGQDTTNKVKVAKIVLNTLYDYANDGAWLPMIASDGVPAYIKAKEEK